MSNVLAMHSHAVCEPDCIHAQQAKLNAETFAGYKDQVREEQRQDRIRFRKTIAKLEAQLAKYECACGVKAEAIDEEHECIKDLGDCPNEEGR
jgi:hypothetical protein